MGRREQREQIFKLLFRVEFNELEEMPQQRDLFLDEIKLPVEEDGLAAREKDLSYIAEKYGRVQEKLSEIDRLINEKTEGWSLGRMGKVEVTLLRLGAYEILFDQDVPDSVAINEAVELAKRYGQDNSGSFVNAVLAKFLSPGQGEKQ